LSEFLGLAGAGAAMAPDPLSRLQPLMEAHGVTATPGTFHSAVKIAFFACGAACYDETYRSHWESLPEQFQRISSDFLTKVAPFSTKMSALDVGCGTGMSAEMLLATRLGSFIRQIDLLDPSDEMLKLAATREGLRSTGHRPIRGVIQDLPARYKYDVIAAGCVLQHVPDLPDFLRQIALRQRQGGIFLHLQDPNGDFLNDSERLERVARLARTRRVLPSTLLKRLSTARPWSRNRERESHIDRVNAMLIQQKTIATRMTAAEIRMAVDLPAHDGRGISLRAMQALLPEYELVSSRSYAFFGELVSDLPPRYQKEERALAAQRAENGSQIAAVWMKRFQG
jgi:SAM-dependent methyltransferase